MSTKICGSLNNDCRFLSIFGHCLSDSFCGSQIKNQCTDESDVIVNLMQNLRALHQENMEIKKLLLELKQNQK
ncbi:MAG: hypothetical protein KBS86_03590 [Proteobacteria bacterium]|nr:hypothetical protein [Candidatus Enterousia scatequi]